jgi:uncharacterized membrane protein YGL010W
MSSYFDLTRSFAFYGSFHANPVNQWIHIICVPIIFTTSIELLLRVSHPIIVTALLVFYITSFIRMHVFAGLAYAPILLMYGYIGAKILPYYSHLSIVLWAFSWIAQFVGHGLFEKRAPALLTNLPQSIHAAVFFVWIELLMKFGLFNKSLERKLNSAVKRERSKFYTDFPSTCTVNTLKTMLTGLLSRTPWRITWWKIYPS